MDTERLQKRVLGKSIPKPTLDGAFGQLIRHGFSFANVTSGLMAIHFQPVVGPMMLPPMPDPPEEELIEAWKELPQAQRCAEETIALSSAIEEFAIRRRIGLYGVSSQDLVLQSGFSNAHRIRQLLLADPELVFADALGLPTFEHISKRHYEPLVLMVRDGIVCACIFPDEQELAVVKVLDWLKLNI